MWKPLQKSPPYFIKLIHEADNFYNVGVTDYKRFWITNTSKKSFLADMKESNNALEFDNENELVERGLDMLINPEALNKVSILQEEHGNFLTISLTKVYECPLKLELGLPEASTEHFFNAVVQPLLKTVCDLRASQHELRELLIRKDKEIEAYKKEGKPARRLKTTIYDDAAHMIKYNTFEGNFGAPEIPDLLKAVAGDQKDLQAPSNTTPIVKGTKEKSPVNTAQSTRAPSHTVLPEQYKIEKASQNSLNDALPSIIPTQIEETEIPGFVIQSTVTKTELDPVPKKRLKKKLNY